MDLELLRSPLPRGQFRLAVFDFDGTLSLIREGWPAVMAGQIRDALGGDEPDVVAEIVVGLNGHPTIVQMTRLASVASRRGGVALSPAEHLAEYERRLTAMTRERYDDLTAGQVAPKSWQVPGAGDFLAELQRRGVPFVVVSGTRIDHVRNELAMLDLERLVGNAVFAPVGDDPMFAKRHVIDRLLADRGIRGDELIGFGDGVVETEEVRLVGGVAVAVASNTPPERGVNAQKRSRLIEAGADAVVGDYANFESLARFFFDAD